MKKSFSIFFVYAIALLLLFPIGQAKTENEKSKPSEKLCAMAGNSQSFCKKLVAKATTKQEALANIINATITHAEEMGVLIPTIERKLSKLQPVAKENVYGNCVDALKSAGANLGAAEKAAKKGDLNQVSKLLTKAAFSGCSEGLNEYNIDLPTKLKKSATLYNKYLDSCLAVADSKAP